MSNWVQLRRPAVWRLTGGGLIRVPTASTARTPVTKPWGLGRMADPNNPDQFNIERPAAGLLSGSLYIETSSHGALPQ